MLFKVREYISENIELNNMLDTPLGELKFEFHHNESIKNEPVTTFKLNDEATLTRFENDYYEIEMVVNPVQFPLHVEKCVGVVWRFKLKQPTARLAFQTAFIKSAIEKVYDGQHHGEDLYALKWHNDDYQLHMGTQDDEYLHERIMKNDYFPVKSDYLYNPFYEDKNGLSIILENIEVGKVGQIHVVISWSKIEQDSSWYAVDLFTKDLLPEQVEY